MKNQVQLITYVDRLSGDLRRLKALLDGPFCGLFGGVHLLPFFNPIDGADAGFDPVDHTEVDPRLGGWNDVRALSDDVEVMADLIVNHISSDSPQFKDFSRTGANSPFASMFLTYDRVFPMGAREADLLRIYRPRPGLPFTNVILESGESRLLWTTFTPQQAGRDGEPGLLAPEDVDQLVETIHSRSNGQSRMATGAAANNLDLYQVNCTFYDALGRSDNQYLIARAIQFFVPGIPQVYCIGLLAGTNDMELLARSNVGRDINRRYYTPSEVENSLKSPVVQKLVELIRLRNDHPAFAGKACVELPDNQRLVIAWENRDHWAKLDVDFSKIRALVTYSKTAVEQEPDIGKWDSLMSVEALRAIL